MPFIISAAPALWKRTAWISTWPAATSAAMERERFISSFDGASLYTADSGAGMPVVLCDGLGCDGYIWKYIRPQLAERYHVVRWNYRGHGLSPVPASLDT